MSVKQSSVDKLVATLAPESEVRRSDLQRMVAIGGEPTKDGDYLRREVPTALTWSEELNASLDFCELEEIPKLKEYAWALEFLRRINKPKVSQNGSGPMPKIDLEDIQPVELKEVQKEATP